MISENFNLLLADDDEDDCLFFKEVLDELEVPANLSIVNDGEQLMHFLANVLPELPFALFLDLNMPRKNGFDCLSEIKQNEKLKELPIVIFSTSLNQEIVNLVYKNKAHYFIRKPNEFLLLKKVIIKALELIRMGNSSQPSFENFILTI